MGKNSKLDKTSFWHSHKIEPKRKFRWIAQIGDGNTVFDYVIQKVTKPEWTTTEKEHKVLGNSFWYPGPVTWNAVEATIVDVASTDAKEGNAALFLYNTILASGYRPPNGFSGKNNSAYHGVNKYDAVESLKHVNMIQQDAHGNALEYWELKNPWIQKINWGGEFDYGADDIVTCALTIRYDWATVSPAGDVAKAMVTNKPGFGLGGGKPLDDPHGSPEMIKHAMDSITKK